MVFKPGQSGNPSGRAKTVGIIKELAQKRSGRAFERVCELVECDDPRVALAACQEVLNRAYGKPHQAIEVSGDVGHYVLRVPVAGGDADKWLITQAQPKQINGTTSRS